jgi:hypothetical protein
MAQNVKPPSLASPVPRRKSCARHAQRCKMTPLANLTSRAEIPIVAALAYVPPPRFRALALFGRRPPERVIGIVGAGVRKPAQEPPSALSGIRQIGIGRQGGTR